MIPRLLSPCSLYRKSIEIETVIECFILAGENRSTQRTICPSAIFSTTKTQAVSEPNQGLRGERLATRRLTNGKCVVDTFLFKGRGVVRGHHFVKG
jgi:hypothetical protein